MAQPTTAKPGKMRVLLGNGADPEVFSAPCGLTTKGLTITKNLSEVTIPDCDDPDAPFWMARDVESMSASISGEGVLAAESEAIWNTAAFSTDSLNVRVEVEFTTGTRVFEGAFHLNEFGVNAQQGQRVSANISLQSDGIVESTWEAA